MILHTGLRTDIPAFYPEWLKNRIEGGFALVRNPFNPNQITKYRISPDVVDVISFCTKNPAPFFPYMDVLKDYAQCWFVTITPYGTDIEPHVPDKEQVMESFIRLSERVGKNAVIWRYDPIFILDKYTVEFHLDAFEYMAKTLSGFTDTCIISFIDLYQKVKRNFPKVREVSPEERITLAKEMVRIGKKYGILIKSCAEGTELAAYGVDTSGCMTAPVYEKAAGFTLNVPKIKGARTECGCLLTCDIGAYHTCGHLCKYCYANDDAEKVKRNMKLHNPNSPFLIGEEEEGMKVHEAVQKSWRNGQMNLII